MVGIQVFTVKFFQLCCMFEKIQRSFRNVLKFGKSKNNPVSATITCRITSSQLGDLELVSFPCPFICRKHQCFDSKQTKVTILNDTCWITSPCCLQCLCKGQLPSSFFFFLTPQYHLMCDSLTQSEFLFSWAPNICHASSIALCQYLVMVSY